MQVCPILSFVGSRRGLQIFDVYISHLGGLGVGFF